MRGVVDQHTHSSTRYYAFQNRVTTEGGTGKQSGWVNSKVSRYENDPNCENVVIFNVILYFTEI